MPETLIPDAPKPQQAPGVPSAGWRQVARHQIGSVITTVVDFGTMMAWVELAGLSPVTATALGASVGAITNFLLGRFWIFHSGARSVPGQALRYALVSAVSLGLNTLGEHVGHNVLGLRYVLARAIVAVLVSLGWNYPLQRFFVFAPAKAGL